MHCQFTREGNKATLADLYDFPSKDIYSIGRLDQDSEGLLILTNDGALKAKLQDPKYEHKKTYWVQVEGEITSDALAELSAGVKISIKGKIHHTLPAKALVLQIEKTKILPDRNPPVREKHPTKWIALSIHEGKNRQVRRMTAKVGFPTLRLVRYSIENITIDQLKPGEVRKVSKEWIMDRIH